MYLSREWTELKRFIRLELGGQGHHHAMYGQKSTFWWFVAMEHQIMIVWRHAVSSSLSSSCYHLQTACFIANVYLCYVMQQCEKQLDVFNITLMRQQAEIAVCFTIHFTFCFIFSACHQMHAIVIVILSVCPSVCHTGDPRLKGPIYQNVLFTTS